jgi:hypothetical protein
MYPEAAVGDPPSIHFIPFSQAKAGIRITSRFPDSHIPLRADLTHSSISFRGAIA